MRGACQLRLSGRSGGGGGGGEVLGLVDGVGLGEITLYMLEMG